MECFHRHIFLSFQAIFCVFVPLLAPKIKIWKKYKKTLGHIILLHICTINQDHMMYGSWDIKFNRQNFFVILGIFFKTPVTPWKMKISKMKKPLGLSSFYTSVPKIMIICYTVPEIWRMTDVVVIFILGYLGFFQALFYYRWMVVTTKS